MNTLTEMALAVAGIPALLLLILMALTQLRDEAFYQGWIRPDSRLGNQAQRAARARVVPALDALGINPQVKAELARTADTAAALGARQPQTQVRRLDVALAKTIKPWIRELDDNDFRGLRWYVDTMGAVHHQAQHDVSLARIMAAWVEYLARHNHIALPGVLLVPKDGNPILAREAAELLPHRPGIIVVKGENDPSRVCTHGVSHETDFEGLRAYLEMHDPGLPATVLAVDDSCTSGHSMMSAINRFNDYVRRKELEATVTPVADAATLYCVRAADDHAQVFTNSPNDVELRSLIALGDDEMSFLVRSNVAELERRVTRFKDEHCVMKDRLAGRVDN
ncbi:MAG TPA: hypothetical protein VM938_09615 [Acidimicrobiales bacterium]|nr:hypothetical protein [Acidimicrobiales bacterium]